MAVLTKNQNERTILGEYTKLNSADLYLFATRILEPICEKYFKYGGIKAAVTTKPSKGVRGSNLHRAAFTVKAKSLQLGDSATEKFSVLCKLYRKNSVNDEIFIDFTAIMGGYYKYFAAVIENVVYYLRYDSVIAYQSIMGNNCATKDGKFICVNAEYWIDQSEYKAEINEADMSVYDAGYVRYINN